jgi:GT2 family glycosyltransferase
MVTAAIKRIKSATPEVTVIIVSYNTRELTLAAVRTLLDNSPGLHMRVVVFDNASADGSAAAVADAFPEVEVIASPENLGFAAANNRVAAGATTPYVCLLNPDTETHPGAINALLAFAKAHPEAGIVGGRTVFRDGSLNPASCWRMMTPWSLFTSTFGLARLFPNSDLLNREAMGGWQRDRVREVDIVVGCLMLVPTDLWRRLGGFDERFFMYGEDADICLRARALGYRPMITPDATIMHLVGASTKRHADKVCAVMQAKSTLIRRHWPRWIVPLGLAQLWLWGLVRGLAGKVHPDPAQRERLSQIWRERERWLGGFPELRGT